MRQRIREALQWVSDRKGAYVEVFLQHPRSRPVLQDLARFCRANQAPVARNTKTGEIDERATFIAIGRQEVWQHIQEYLHLTEEELFELRMAPQAKAQVQQQPEDED